MDGREEGLVLLAREEGLSRVALASTTSCGASCDPHHLCHASCAPWRALGHLA